MDLVPLALPEYPNMGNGGSWFNHASQQAFAHLFHHTAVLPKAIGMAFILKLLSCGC